MKPAHVMRSMYLTNGDPDGGEDLFHQHASPEPIAFPEDDPVALGRGSVQMLSTMNDNCLYKSPLGPGRGPGEYVLPKLAERGVDDLLFLLPGKAGAKCALECALHVLPLKD